MGKRYSANIFLWYRKVYICLLTTENRRKLSPKAIFLRLAFILFFLLASNAGYIYAESLEDEGIKEVVVNALHGLENNNADEFMADFSKKNFMGKVMSGVNAGKMLSYEEFKNNFISASARRTILSVSDIRFSGINVSNNSANVTVEFSMSVLILETYKTVEAQPSISVVLKKDDDGWKIHGWNWPGPSNAALLRKPQE